MTLGAAWGWVLARRRAFSVLFVLLLALQQSAGDLLRVVRDWNDRSVPSWVGALPGEAKLGEPVCDLDTRLLHEQFVQTPTLRETLVWWHGPCVQGVPFYRPLSSYALWGMWEAFGERESRYRLVSVLLNLLAVWQLALLFGTLLEKFRVPLPELGVILASWFFTTGGFVLIEQPAAMGLVQGLWKNVPDSLSLCFFALALRRYANPPQPSLAAREGAGVRGGWVPKLAFLAVCLCKEAGIFLPVLLVVLEGGNLLSGKSERIAALKRLAPFFAILAAYFIVRSLSLHDLYGFRYGSNGSWGFRLLSRVAGPVSATLTSYDFAPLASCLLLGFAYALFQRKPNVWKVLVLIPAVAVVAGGLHRIVQGEFDPVGGTILLLTPEARWETIGWLGFLLPTYWAFRAHGWLAALGYLWALLALGMTLFSPSVMHRYYLMNAGFSLVLGVGGAVLADRVWQAIEPRVARWRKPVV